MLNTWKAALALGLLAGTCAAGGQSAMAQTATFPDAPENHWAYQAVQDLANKGYVKGYPDGKFLGKRAMTRYEFATVVDRMAQTIDDLAAQVKAGQAVTTPNGTPVTQDDLNKIQVLIDAFQKQLADIQSVTAGAAGPFQDQIDALRQDVLDVQARVGKAQSTADNSYGVGSTRKFQISGYIQARYQQAGSGQGNYPSGKSAKAGSYNGNYALGGNTDSFEVRRARLKFTGHVTDNTQYGAQIDLSGAVNAGSTPNQQVTVREAYVKYTFGDGDESKQLSVTAGEFANPFGYELPTSSAAILTPERPLAFSELSYGIWANQDYDKGVQLSYNTPQQLIGFLPGGLKLTVAAVNGDGRTSENTDRRIDEIYRVAYQTPDKVLGVGASYYDGQVPEVGAGSTGPTGSKYNSDKKDLFGVDAQYTAPFGLFVLGEYEAGRYEDLFRFTSQSASSAIDAHGNHIEGYYGQAGWTFFNKTDKPLSVYVSYDKLRRASSGPFSNSSYDDENVGYGASYNLDKATRFRIYYIQPDKIAHAPTISEPQKFAETIGEIQVRF